MIGETVSIISVHRNGRQGMDVVVIDGVVYLEDLEHPGEEVVRLVGIEGEKFIPESEWERQMDAMPAPILLEFGDLELMVASWNVKALAGVTQVAVSEN
jgi:hypothetical protein